MEENFQHVVFFQCSKLSEDQKRKIESYCQVRRKSGGGDCGSVVPVQGDVYSIAFREKADQQRVLQKSQHVVDAPGGSLVLTVRDGSSSSDSSSSGPSANPEVTPAASLQEQSQKLRPPPKPEQSQKPRPPPKPEQSQTLIPPPKPEQSQTLRPPPRPPRQEEHEVHLDRYVVRFLRESPDVRKEVDRRLASMACSVSSVKDEMIAVCHDVPLGAAANVGNWKVAVSKVFDSFVCHYEPDSRKIKALLQSSRQSSDGVKVYSDVGMAVVVGERCQVSAVLEEIEDSLVKRRASGAGEKRTSTHRLGEAKLRLLSENITSSLGEKFPDVAVRQGDAGQLVLSGSVEEIANAGKLISHLEKLVLQRTVSDKSPHLLSFLRKVYGAPGKRLWGGSEVEIEIGNIELHLFSLSKNKLDETVNRIEETFKDVKFDVPNCSVVPAELMEQLRSKSSEMNQGSWRVEVVLGLDSSVWLLGHTKEVLELSQVVTQFILDQASIQGKAALPFPQLVQQLPGFLQLHDFDHSGVTLHPLTSASGPVVALEGPAGKVTEVKSRLDSFLATLTQEKITVDRPGAVRFFKSPSGRESMATIARAQRSLIQLEEQPQPLSRSSKTAKYTLQHGIEVLVCQGDITQQNADALVNAANEQLEHGGGLAAALSTAGGPQVQIESRNIVRRSGKIATGSAVLTTSGNLKCKKLIHAVGPVSGQVGGREGLLLEKTVQSALNLAEQMDFKSIAIPCISSGLFGMPLNVCSDTIVSAVKTFGSQAGRRLSRITLIDTKADVVAALQDACDRLLQGPGRAKQGAATEGAVGGASAAPPKKTIPVEILHGTIETQQVDVIVAPLAGLSLTSTRVGIALLNVSGPQLKVDFDRVASVGSNPGDVFVVENTTALKCKAVVFTWLTAWDNKDFPMQVLRQGIRDTLSSCDERGFTSVAFPLLGTGQLLNFPPSVASKVLLEEIRTFEQQRNSRTPFVVRVVIHPKNKESYKAFKSALDASQPGGATSDPARGFFYHCTSVSTDRITAMLGNVALQMVQDNITNGGTDVIVNSTDFSNNNIGVSKAILDAAGPTVQQELSKAGLPPDLFCYTGPGLLGCKEIIHAMFNNDSQTIRKHCKKIVKQCESRRYQSVAFPAINTGQGGMDAAKACRAMLDGMAEAIADLKPQSLSLIRIVILQPKVFKAFRAELESRFGQDVPSQVSLKEVAKQVLRKWQDKDKPRGTVTPSAPQAQIILSSKPPRAVMTVISCGSDTVKVVKKELEDELHQQQLERQVDAQHISRLDATEVEALQVTVKALAVSLEHRSYHGSGGGPYMSVGTGSGKEIYVLKGLKEDVLSVVELINKAIQTELCKDLRDKEVAMLALTVQWSIKDARGTWQELSLYDNYKLEQAHVSKQASVDIMTPASLTVSVNLKKQEATDSQTGKKYKVTRSESETGLELPPHWEPMNDEVFKRVELQMQSEEYKDIAQGFLKTAKYTIQKIERVQNVYLWHAFSVCKQRILKKNGQGNLGEKLLYHGTSAETCDCIEKDRFDRNYAGKNATAYGKGVYFAVDAEYSAGRYSPADKSGLKRLYAARVLTGRYTTGKSTMVAPPPRGSDATDCYDSLVDKILRPTMFVVFHDDQAYPEYRITFK